ncbi:methyltransferase domain-containing protein [Paenibacillus sp. GYB003]|uniref:methyltransferase domain-containing protein n=1 Tax=Paenibacillus sp. GYB003 TaxID=2994392 RepID=UPI002F96E8C7
MDDKTARERAELSGKLTNVLDARTLAGSHRRLAEIVRPGMTVLDVGCGTGSITRGIAEATGPSGSVLGVDSNAKLIEKARRAHGGTPGLAFEEGDAYELAYEERFDIVTSARLLVWLSDPLRALKRMTAAAKRGGRVVIADYNHVKIKWGTKPPASMLAFYDAYLQWRSDAGLDNAIADRLPALFERAGLARVAVTPQHEETRRGDPDFAVRIAIWADTASSRGPQMAKDGYVTEREYKTAEDEYREWIRSDADSLTMYMLAVEGVKER